MDEVVGDVPSRWGHERARLTAPAWQRHLLVTALVPALLVAPLSLAGILLGNVALAVSLLPLLTVLLARRALRRREVLGGGSLSVNGDELLVEGQRRTARVALRDVRAGVHDGTSLELDLGAGRRLELELANAADAESLLARTGTSVARSTLTFPLRASIGPFVAGLLYFFALYWPVSLALSWLARLVAGVVGTSSLDLNLLSSTVVASALAFVLSWVLARARVPKVTVGQDGLSIRRWFGRRFIPHSAVTGVGLVSPATSGSSSGLELRLGNESLKLWMIGAGSEHVLRVMSRIEDARRAFEDAKHAIPAGDASFVRRGKTVSEWREQLLDAGFRKRAVTTADAEAVLGDPSRPLEQRAGAALALRALEPNRAARRIRVAADVAAEPRAHALLLAMLEDDAALETALDELVAAERED